jgi:hypothetical protein
MSPYGRPEAARTCGSARARGRRWRARLLAGDRGSVAATRGLRCWVHKTANVLNKLPKSRQSKAKRALQEIWMADQEGCTRRVRCLRRKLGRQIRQSGRVLDQGSRRAARLLTTSRPSTGSICARPTSSKAYLRTCVTAPCARMDVSRIRPRSP